MPHDRRTSMGLLSARQVNTWFQGLGAAFFGDGPSAEDMRASVSWRVTVPLRQIHARERINRLRSGRLPLLLADGSGDDPLSRAREAMRERLVAVAPHLLQGSVSSFATSSLEELLGALVSRLHPRYETSQLWLLLVAVSACIPDAALLQGLARDLRGCDAEEATRRVLAHAGVWMRQHDSFLRRIDVVSDRPVVFVDFSARHGFNSGVQRVTREVVRAWTAEARQFSLVALTEGGVALRQLAPDEGARVRAWDQSKAEERSVGDDSEYRLVVPWNTTVFLPEVTDDRGSRTLSSIARFSRNATCAIGYDAIPATSGHTVGPVERLRFSAYLAMLKYVDEVVAISASAGEEFSGIADALAVQGLTGPRVRSILLPLERIQAEQSPVASVTDHARPVILAVGSNERRKNHLAILFAAEVLWREGHEFSLVLMGGSGGPDFTDVGRACAALRQHGRPVLVRHDVSESELAAAYLTARFSVFLSLHEGYGLPVAESLASGTPVLTTSFGSTAEIAEGGGCLSVDPRDDDAIVDGMRRLLLDDGLLDELRAQIEARRDTNWSAYADSLWAVLTSEQEARS